MLELLTKYAEEEGLEIEPGFGPKTVNWAVQLDNRGNLLDVTPLQQRVFPKCPDLSQGEMIAGGVTRSHFLVDTVEVVTLFIKATGNSEEAVDPKTIRKHDYFKELIARVASEAALSEFAVLANCLNNSACVENIRKRLLAQKGTPTERVTFAIDGKFLLDSMDWHDWWRLYRNSLAEVSSKKALVKSDEMLCMITGLPDKPAKTHSKISKLSDVGGMPSGDVLIGFDKDAFASYGLEQSANAPVCENCAAAYRAALNHLLSETGQRLGGSKVVHWFKEKIAIEEDPLPFLVEGSDAEEVEAKKRFKTLLNSINSGLRPDLANNHYYSLVMSGASGRIMIRDWIDGKFRALLQNVIMWFEDMAIVNRNGLELCSDPKFLAVIGSLGREFRDVPSPLISKLWRVAARGERIPQSILASALARIRVDLIRDEPANHARMGLLRAYHLRKNQKHGGDLMEKQLGPFLNESHPSPAYQCGRLIALLAALQRSALGNVGAGVIERYYAAASSTPALVLGRLVRTSQFHLAKLEPPLAAWYERKLALIWSQIQNGVPKTLDLEEQSLFALGYYQQLANLRAGSKSADQPNLKKKDE
jgi:CRISPR-associated protein Csd1